MSHPIEQYDIEVELTLLPTKDGGRSVPIWSGYRSGHFYLDGIRWIASFHLKDRDIMFPGETAPVLIDFFYYPEDLAGRLHIGKPFLLLESTHTIGTGTIIAMLNFDAHAEASRRRHQESQSHTQDDGQRREK